MKAYVKPAVYYEDFQLTEHIAGNCDFISTHAEYDCPATGEQGTGMEKVVLFQSNACTTILSPGALEGYCYTSQQEGMIIFTS